MSQRSVLSEVPGIMSLAVPIVIGLAGSTLHAFVASVMLGPLGGGAARRGRASRRPRT